MKLTKNEAELFGFVDHVDIVLRFALLSVLSFWKTLSADKILYDKYTPWQDNPNNDFPQW